MYIVILGGGRVGLSLADRLIIHGYDVTIIESNEDLCDQATEELDAMIICGNGTDTKTLEEANIEEADVFVATTGNDESNLLSCILVKEYTDGQIIARVSNPDHEEAFKKVGIDKVISPERTAAGFLEKIITRPNVADLTAFGAGNAEILDITLNRVYYLLRRNKTKLDTNTKKYDYYEVKSLKDSGLKPKEISEKLNIPIRTVYYILNNK